MTLSQWAISYLIVGLPVGIFLSRHYGQTLLGILRGEEVTVYGRDVVNAQKRADELLDSVKDIREIQLVVSDRVMAFLFALVMTIFCLVATVTWIYQMWKLSNYNHKMQIKERP